jgi:hypothetical protein
MPEIISVILMFVAVHFAYQATYNVNLSIWAGLIAFGLTYLIANWIWWK